MTQLKQGSRGAKVSRLQERLGVYPDGVFGSRTATAVREYQLRNNLAADGIVGMRTWTKMFIHDVQDTFRPDPTVVGDVFQDPEKLIGSLLGNIFNNNARNKRYLLNGYTAIEPHLKALSLDTPQRMMHFIAQVRWEVGRNITVVENLNYNEKGLKNTFKYFRINPKLRRKYCRTAFQRANQEMIANCAYANRGGNGSVASGDGWAYRGRGGKMVTLRDNYVRENVTVLNEFPEIYDAGYTPLANHDLLKSDNYWLLSAAIFWKINGLYNAADVGLGRKASYKVTSIVNYHTQSYAGRYAMLNKIAKLYGHG